MSEQVPTATRVTVVPATVQVADEVDAIKGMRIVDKSKNVYANPMARFLVFLRNVHDGDGLTLGYRARRCRRMRRKQKSTPRSGSR